MVKISLDNWTFWPYGQGEAKRTKDGLEIFKSGIHLVPPQRKLTLPKDKINKAFLRYSINNRLNKWGKRVKLEKIET